MFSRTEEQNKQPLLKIVMALSNSEVCLYSSCFAVFKRHFKIMQELEKFSDITATTFGDCASKIWYRLVISNLLIVDY